MWFDMIPVFSHHLKDTTTDTVPFHRRFCHLFSNNHRHTAMNPMFVFTVFEQNGPVANRMAVTIEVA